MFNFNICKFDIRACWLVTYHSRFCVWNFRSRRTKGIADKKLHVTYEIIWKREICSNNISWLLCRFCHAVLWSPCRWSSKGNWNVKGLCLCAINYFMKNFPLFNSRCLAGLWCDIIDWKYEITESFFLLFKILNP